MLATAENRSDALRLREGGLRSGLSRIEITEALMQLAVFTGFPTALNA
jgi:4-carboxymuconolactone decarboxylase